MGGPAGAALLVAWAGILLVAASMAPVPAAAQSASTGYINIVEAENHGCSGDVLSSPDLRITVTIDGGVAMRSAKGQDLEEPLYAELSEAIALSGGSVVVGIQGEEAEPGGFFGLGTEWVPCDMAPGPETTYTFTWSGEERTVVASGDQGNAARATVVFGSAPPARPTVTTVATQADQVTIGWDAGPAGSSHRVAWGGVGEVIAAYGPDAGQHTFTGLCENTDLTLRVVRDAAPWHVASQDVQVRSANAAPGAPRIRSVAPNGSAALATFELPTPQDLVRLDYHWAEDASFTADAGNLVGQNISRPWSYDMQERLELPAAGGYLRIRVTDSGGLTTTSEAFAVGGPARARQDPGPCSGGIMAPTFEPAPMPTPPAFPTGPGGGPVFDPSLPGDGDGIDEDGAGRSEERPGPYDALLRWGLLAALGAIVLGVIIGLALRRR